VTHHATIASLRIEDYDELVALWSAAGLPARPAGRDTRAEIARQLALPSSIYLAARADGRMVGAVLGTHDGRKGWINRLAVLPEHQGQGIARLLVEEAERRLAGEGIGIVACLIEGWNAASVEVFKRLGYEPFEGIHYLTKRDRPDV
jgi:ribosomal protein S18 acetylase RimI-like enzyme